MGVFSSKLEYLGVTCGFFAQGCRPYVLIDNENVTHYVTPMSCWLCGLPQSFEIPDLPVRWYTFKKRPAPARGTPALELPEEAEGDPSTVNGDTRGGEAVDAESDDEDVEDDLPEEVLPPPPALKGLYAPGVEGNFLLAMGGWARGAIFECSLQVVIARC